jgi:hypothetical protein
MENLLLTRSKKVGYDWFVDEKVKEIYSVTHSSITNFAG